MLLPSGNPWGMRQIVRARKKKRLGRCVARRSLIREGNMREPIELNPSLDSE
jgi:hypothetical protein